MYKSDQDGQRSAKRSLEDQKIKSKTDFIHTFKRTMISNTNRFNKSK